MNILTAPRPGDEEDPLAPIKAPEVPPPSVAAPQILNDDDDSAGSGGSAPGSGMVASPTTGMLIPQDSHSRGGVGPSQSQTIATEADMAARANIQQAQGTQLEAGDKLHQVAKPVTQEEHETAMQRQAAADERLRKTQDANEAYQADVARRNQADREAQLRLQKDSKITDLMEDRGVPAKIMAAFLVGLHRVGQGMSGDHNGPNQAVAMLQAAQADDRAKKMARYTHSKEYISLLATDRAAAREAHDVELKNILNSEIAFNNLMDRQLGTVTAKSKVEGADAAHQAARAKLQEENAAKQQKIEADNAVKAQSGHATWSDTQYNKPSTSGDKNLTVPGWGQAPDEITRRKMSDKAAAFEKVKALTDRLSKANVKADLGSEERQQIENDTKDLTTAIAIMNNNEGKPSDGDMKIAAGQVGSILGMGARATAAEKLGKPGLDPRTAWGILGKRMTEKWRADLKSTLGTGLDKGAYDALGGKPDDEKAPQSAPAKPLSAKAESPNKAPETKQQTKDLAHATAMMKSKSLSKAERDQWRKIHQHLLDSR